MSFSIADTVQLASGRKMPRLGFGTWKLKDGKEVKEAVAHAIEAGYRHIDTAAAYENEKGVGQAIRDCEVPRESIFLTTKVWNDDIRGGHAGVKRAFEASLKTLDVGHIDLLLLHWPITPAKNRDAWKTLEELYHAGKVRSIGVSNYLVHHLETLLETAEVTPMVNQVEFHPYLLQPELATFCRDHGIVREAWSPLMQGEAAKVPEIVAIAKAHNRTPAQIVLHWDLQHQVLTIPKSTNPKRIKENAGLFDFELTPDDIAKLDQLDRGQRFGPDPDKVDF
ncbi:aldo/keto reductase [Oleiharenicola lentus]|uniref:aldo/keto reductase n=1 Tax=Oleiharenicola lentus TaxID=2508720 RepID=UPI003F667846